MFALRNQLLGIALVLALAVFVLAGWSRSGPDVGPKCAVIGADCAAMQKRDKKPIADTKPEQKPGPTIDAADLAIMKALNSTMKISIKQIPMKDVLEMLEESTKGALNFIIDEQTLRSIDVGLPETFLNDQVTKVIGRPQKIRTLLKLILGERNMGYYIDDGSLWITTASVAKSKTVVKNYPVANLVGGQQLIQVAVREMNLGSNQLGPKGKLLSQNIDGLTETIKGTVEPEYWADNGGPGSMVFIPATASLQVRASREVQYLLMASGLLDNSRQAPVERSEIQDAKKEVVHVIDITGLIDPKNYERSKDELLKALSLLDGKSKGEGMVILAEGRLLVVRQTPENLFQIAQLIADMRSALGRLQPMPPPPAPKVPPPAQPADPFAAPPQPSGFSGAFGPAGGVAPRGAPGNQAVPANKDKKRPILPRNS